MAGDVKLTKAQLALLRKISDQPQSVIDTYVPAKRLADLKYAVRTYGKFSRMNVAITDAGRAALAQHDTPVPETRADDAGGGTL